MSYKIKSSKAPKPEYFQEQEYAMLRKKYHGKVPPMKVLVRQGTRQASGMYPLIYEKGNAVEYKGHFGKVEKVTRAGIWIRIVKKDRTGLPSKMSKPMFVSTKEVEAGKVYPPFTNIPVVFALPFSMEKGKHGF